MDKKKAQEALGELIDIGAMLKGDEFLTINFDKSRLVVNLFSDVYQDRNKLVGFGEDFDQVVAQVRDRVESHMREMERDSMKYRKLIGRMAEKGFTQKDLADKLGLVPQTFRYKMQGKYEFKMSEAFAIAKVLDIEPSEFDAYFGGEA